MKNEESVGAEIGKPVGNSSFFILHSSLEEKEIELIQKMSEYGAAVEQAGKDYSPSGIANYCYELTKVFNQFYHDFSILNEPDEQKKAIRLMLAKNVAKIIKNAMALLGIEVPERM
jgi:arginyl-tRNA synthetase